MIILAFPGLKEYCQITYNLYRDWWESVDFYTRTGLQPRFDEQGTFLEAVEKRAREQIFPEYLNQLSANGYQVELFDILPP